MRAKTNYFPQEPKDPMPLRARTNCRVRFDEVDSMDIVWHGRYVSYFENGRMALADSFGFSYQLFREKGVAAPIVKLHAEYMRPLHFDENIIIEAALHWVESARINISYTIFTSNGQVAATGYTVQMLTTFEGTPILLCPEWLTEFRQKWRSGLWSNA